MQMFGVGVLELLVIMILAVIVVGPDRMPQLAADLARWIRHTRAYAKHLMGDFNEVVSDLQREAGASQEDWREIANVVTRHTGAVGQELGRFGRDVGDAGDLTEIKEAATTPQESNGTTVRNGARNSQVQAEADSEDDEEAEELEEEEEIEQPEPVATGEEKPWYVTDKAPRPSRSRTRSNE